MLMQFRGRKRRRIEDLDKIHVGIIGTFKSVVIFIF
jgi:hypothetical protein